MRSGATARKPEVRWAIDVWEGVSQVQAVCVQSARIGVYWVVVLDRERLHEVTIAEWRWSTQQVDS